MHQAPTDPASILRHCYAAAVRAVQPETALYRPLREVEPGDPPSWVISVGKAANGMAQAIVGWLSEQDRTVGGGIVVAAEAQVPPSPLRLVVGDHPIAGPSSVAAADAIEETVQRIPVDADVHVAVSGGASALMAGPSAPLRVDDLVKTFEVLLSSGLDIREMNAVRKRITRWSAGRLALRLAPRRIFLWIISDVAGDDVASIASGPCSGDPWTSDAVCSLLESRGILCKLPQAVQEAMRLETPKSMNPILAAIAPRIVANNAMALAAAAAAARRLGLAVQVMPEPLAGEAAEMGRTIASAMNMQRRERTILIWGGETVVTIRGDAGVGGRAQELALAAAAAMQAGSGVLLSAGTDGRDGPTDAAGAIVGATTWAAIAASGRDPAADLLRHDAYPALASVNALLRTGPSGTNVMDIALATTGWS